MTVPDPTPARRRVGVLLLGLVGAWAAVPLLHGPEGPWMRRAFEGVSVAWGYLDARWWPLTALAGFAAGAGLALAAFRVRP